MQVSMFLPVFLSPIAAELLCGQEDSLHCLPDSFLGFSDKAAAELAFNCYPGVCSMDTCSQFLVTAKHHQ